MTLVGLCQLSKGPFAVRLIARRRLFNWGNHPMRAEASDGLPVVACVAAVKCREVKTAGHFRIIPGYQIGGITPMVRIAENQSLRMQTHSAAATNERQMI
jgi:hypothetical protein